MPNIKIALPSIIVEAIAATAEMRWIARARDVTISFVSNDTIVIRNVGNDTADL
jgi:hypothetical protein